jgi:hypothetical protein
MVVNELTSFNTTVHTLSLDELAKEHHRPCPTNPKTRREWMETLRDTARSDFGLEWFGGIRNLDEAAAILEQGWPSGAARIRELATEIHAPAAKAIRRKIAWRHDGDEICTDRLRSGELDTCWRGSRRQNCAGPTLVTVNVNWGGLVSVSADGLFWQGGAACALADSLEESGYRVRIIANNWSRVVKSADLRMLVRVVVKDFDEPMRLDAMAAVLAHAGIYRTFGFMAKEQSRLPVDTGHGSTREITPGLMEALNDGSEQSLILGKAYSREAAVLALRNVVGALNGEQVA